MDRIQIRERVLSGVPGVQHQLRVLYTAQFVSLELEVFH